MNSVAAYNGSIWLADGERFGRYVEAARVRPCPTSAQIRERHKELMQLAKDLPELALQSRGVDDPSEVRIDARRSIRAAKGKVGVIPIYGPVSQRMSAEMEKAGGTSLDFVSAALDSLLGNASVGAIVLRFDSPGGSVDGVAELADKIYAARAQKPIYAIADSTCASAALWIASAATMFFSTPAGGGYTCGSVGCYVMHINEAAAMEDQGIKVTMIYAGRYKVEMNSLGPPSEEGIVEVERLVTGITANFTAALSRGRNTTAANVRSNYGEGRMLTAANALAVGMIDRVLSYSDLIAKLTGDGTVASSSGERAANGERAAQLRRRFEFNRRGGAVSSTVTARPSDAGTIQPADKPLRPSSISVAGTGTVENNPRRPFAFDPVEPTRYE